MPATAVKPAGPAKLEAEVQSQIAKVVRRIRTHDVLCGAFLLGVVAFGYLAVTIALDRWLDLPAWVRQLGLLGLLAGLAATAFYGIVRPLRKTVNPLYAAREIEETIEDAKNSLVNWVDLQDKEMSDGVRAVVAARAAKQFKDADLDKAGESKRLLWLGGTMAGSLVALAVLFMLFKPTVFNSLVGRALNPFSAGAIATRTQITLVEPKDGDLTVTAGQPVTVGVTIGGKIPDADSSDRLVVQLRHNPADQNYDEVPLESGASYRDWSVRLPERLVQNGFWYRVKGGDAVTAEHRVTVRPKPVFTDFEVNYEYPAYLMMKPDTGRSPHLEAHRGTVVTITAKANRTLKDGRAVVSNQPAPIPGEVVAESRDTLRLRMTLDQSGSYRLFFNSVEGEANPDAPVYDIRVLTDQPPTVTITGPKDEETALPINGTLAVDGQVTDDFGVEKVTLRARLVAPNGPAKPLKAKPFLNGESFKRAADGTYPTAVEYKDSYPLDKLTDEVGKPVELKPDAVIEYWLEATDNCMVPEANVGRSKVQRVRLVPAKVEEPKDADAVKQQVARRKQDEADLQKQQKQKLDQEARPAKPSPQQKNADAEPIGKGGEPKDAAENPTGRGPDTEPMPQANPMEKPAPKAAQAPPPTGNENPPMPASDPMKKAAQDAAAQKELQRQAEDIQKKLEQLEKKPAEAKGADQPPPDQQSASGEKKPQPASADAAQPKQEPASEPKPSPMKSDNQTAGGDPQEKAGPLGGSGATDKKSPDDQADPMAKADPKTADGSKDNTKQPAESKGGDARGEKPAAPGEAKKGPKPDGGERPTADSKGSPDTEAKPMGGPKESAAEPKGEGNAKENKDAKKPEGGSQQTANKDPWKRGTDKAAPKDEKNPQRPDLEKSLNDLAGNDEKAKQEARQKLEQEFGKDATDRAEKGMQKQKEIADGLQSNDPMRRAKAQQELTDLQREAAERNGGERERERQSDDAEKLDRKDTDQKLKDLNSDDAKKQQQAQEELGKKNGADAAQRAKQLGDDLKSGDKDRQAGAQDELTKMQDQAKQKEQAGRQKGVEEAVKNLAGDDDRKKQEGREALDKAVGQEARQQAEQEIEERKKTAEQLRSKDPMQRAEGQKNLDELQKKKLDQAQQDRAGGKADEQAKQELQKAARDLNSDDPLKRQAAEKKLDEMVGEKARKEAQQLADDLKSDDKDRQRGAQEKVKKLQEQAEKQAKADQQKGGADAAKASAEKQKELERAAKDLAGNDEQKKQAAREKLDKEFGPDARKDFEKRVEERKKAAEDLNSNDPQRQARGEEKRAELQREELSRGQRPHQADDAKRLDRKAVDDAIKDLNGEDAAKKEQARKKLDEQFGPGAADKAEELAKNMKGPDRDRAKEELKKLQENAEKQAQGKPMPKEGEPKADKKPSAEEIEKLAQAAKDLKSPDDQKRKDAEKRLDDAIGEQARKQLQEQLKDDAPPSPEQADALKKALERLAKDQPGRKGDPRGTGAPGNTADEKSKPLDANKEYDKKAEDLRLLDNLKEIRDKKRARELGYTDEELRRFIDGFEKALKEAPDAKDDAADQPKADAAKPTAAVGSAGRLENRANGSKTTTNGGGVTAAPPGYGDARKRFAEGAARPKDEPKK